MRKLMQRIITRNWCNILSTRQKASPLIFFSSVANKLLQLGVLTSMPNNTTFFFNIGIFWCCREIHHKHMIYLIGQKAWFYHQWLLRYPLKCGSARTEVLEEIVLEVLIIIAARGMFTVKGTPSIPASHFLIIISPVPPTRWEVSPPLTQSYLYR